MDQEEPIAVLIKEDHVRWRIELRDLAAIREALGARLLNAFCACSVHADRLRGLIDVTYLCKMNYRNGVAEAARNLEALSAFGTRTLSDLLPALATLLDAAAARGVFDHSATSWTRLDAFVRRWEHDRFYRDALLVTTREEAVIDRGLSGIEAQPGVVLCHGRGSVLQQCSAVLGPRALSIGSGFTESDSDRFLVALSEHGSLPTTVHEAFVLALRAAGVPLVELPLEKRPPVGEPV